MKQRFRAFLKSLGPGILFASTCIGVSHLVQSTRAGALFGFGLLWAVFAANILKYPFFEFGSRFANATGKSIIDGYNKLGRWVLWLYLLITLGTMFFVAAAVGAVTAGFLDNLFGISQHFGKGLFIYVLGGLFLLCIGILLFGQYKVLDNLIKVVGSILLISTITAFVLTVANGPATTDQSWFATEVFKPGSADFLFLIALMGWMPTAVDLSAWNSLWTLERIKTSGYYPSLKETLAEFNFGYIVTAILAPCFLILGAYLIYGTDKVMPESSAGFAHSIIGLYTSSIGSWSYLFIAASAFSIMFGTCIAVFDGFARCLERVTDIMVSKDDPDPVNSGVTASNKNHYRITLLIVGIGAFIVVFQFGNKLKDLVDVATSISFVVAPVIAILNYKLVTGNQMPDEAKPPNWLKYLSWAGILFLMSFTLVYLIYS